MIIQVLCLLIMGVTLLVLVGLIQSRINDNKTYIYKEKKYFIHNRGLMKDRTTGHWVSAIIYYNPENDKLFIREEEDFYDRFRPLKDIKDELKDLQQTQAKGAD